MSTTILKTINLSIGYTSNKKVNSPLFDNISLDIKKGQLIGLLGINGIGKSTLLRTLSGFQPFIQGDIIVNDKKLLDWSSRERAQLLSVVLTEKIQSMSLSVLELLQISRTPYSSWSSNLSSDDNFWIEKAIDLTDINLFLHAKMSNLSDGQLQRVLVARAIAQNTPIIFLDEPSSHLDLNHKVKLYQLLQNLCVEENKTIIFSSHDIDLTLTFADETIVMKPNQIIQGTTDHLIEQNVFHDFFDDNTLQFDSTQKRFVIVP